MIQQPLHRVPYLIHKTKICRRPRFFRELKEYPYKLREKMEKEEVSTSFVLSMAAQLHETAKQIEALAS
jgi:hypothetical protein